MKRRKRSAKASQEVGVKERTMNQNLDFFRGLLERKVSPC